MFVSRSTNQATNALVKDVCSLSDLEGRIFPPSSVIYDVIFHDLV